jgi:dihydrolipoamide dehydrogenase
MNDLIIIGAGPGGYELAIEAGKKGLKTVLIEERKLGGTCLNEGCIPTKAFHKNASFMRDLKHADELGISISDEISLQFEKVLHRKNQIVSDLHQGIEFMLKQANVQIIYGTGKCVDNHTVSVENEIFEAKNIVIATGSFPVMLKGFEDALTSTELLDIDQVPKKLIIIGGGVIGVEFACIFRAFGSHVEIVEYEDRLIPTADKEVSKRLQVFLKQQGIVVHTSTKAIRKDDSFVFVEQKQKEIALEYTQVLLSVGRKPRVENLGLEEVGIRYSKKGIEVNHYMQTSIPNIYAIGDVSGEWMLAHYATYAGFIALDHILSQPSKIRLELTPSCVFSFPEIAWVGLTQEQCSQQAIDHVIHKSMYRGNGKAMAALETDGFVKIITSNNLIIGAHIIGYQASVLIHEIAALMHKGITREEFVDIIHAHPTLSELLSSAMRT